MNPPDVIEAKYHAAMQRLVRQMTAMTERELRKLYKSPEAPRVAMDASFASMAAKLIRALQRRFNVLFSDKAGGLAEALVKGISRQSAVGLKGSLKKRFNSTLLHFKHISGQQNFERQLSSTYM